MRPTPIALPPGTVSTERPTAWSELPPAARWFRIAHAAWAVVSFAALAEVWRAGLAPRGCRDGGDRLAASIAWLALEGALLAVGRGDCPAGPLQRRLGDPVPLFALVLPPRAATAAVPVLAAVSAVGVALAVGRRANLTRPDGRAR